MHKLRVRRIIAYSQACMPLYQFHHRHTLDARCIPRQRQRPTRQQQTLPHRQRLTQHLRNLAEMLNAIGQVPNYRMHTWPAWNLLHMQIGLPAIAMCQHQHAYLPLAPDLELISSARSASAFIQFLVRDMLTVQILPDKNGRRLNILPFTFYAEGIIAGRQRHKKRRPATRKRIQHSQPFGKPPTITSCKHSNIEQYPRENLIRLTLIATHLRHLQRNKRSKAWLQRTQ